MPQVYFNLAAVDYAAERDGASRSEVLRDAVSEYLHGRAALIAEGAGPLLDPDCRAGKCGSCAGAPCEHECHRPRPMETAGCMT